MVEIVSGNQLGLVNSSVALLGTGGGVGNAQLGKNGDQVFLNAATGNLVIENTDEILAASGSDLSLVRTYNSQGLLNDANGDNWRLSVDRRVYGLTGTVNTAGSTITKQFGDGSEVIYTYNAATGVYVAKDGANANDTLAYSATALQWTWTDGATQGKETYNATGQMIQSSDINGNTTKYAYTGSYLTQITDPSGQTTYLDYTGNNLTDIRVVSGGVTQTRTRYTYDSSNRLSQVIVDLSPSDNSITDGNTYTTTYTYDGSSDRVASITSGDGSTVSFTYTLLNGAYRVATYKDGDGNVSTLSYGTASTVTNATPIDLLAHASALSTTVPPYYTVASGATWASVVLAVYGSSDAAAATALQTALGNPALTAGAHLNVPVMFTYTPAATAKTVFEHTTITSPLGQVTTLKTDAQGRIVGLLSPSVGTGSLETDYAYNAAGNLSTITDDPAGRNLITTIQYDANGNVLLRRDAAGDTVTSTYSATNQLLTQTSYTVPDPAGTGETAASGPQTTRFAYDSRGNLRFIISPQGRVTEYRYDASGNRLTQITYQGATINLSALTLSTAVTEAQMITWVVGEDLANVAVQRTDYAYDFRGNLTSATSYAATAATGGSSTASGLTGADVGTTGAAGSSSLSGSTVTVKGAGADVYGTADAFQFDSQAFNGDGSITARVVSQTNTNAAAKAGVMIRESTAAGAQNVFMEITPTSGSIMQSRVGTNATTVTVHGSVVAAPYWVRLTRAGNTFTGFISTDGINWTQVNQVVVPMATSVLAGLAVTSHLAGTLSTAVFDNVSIVGGAAAPPAGASVTQYVYDQRGLLLQTIDPRGVGTSGPTQYLTTYTYDGLGRQLSQVRWTPTGNVTTSTEVYTGATKTATVTLANGLVSTSTFDAAGRLLSVAQSSGGTALGTTTYQYDANGELRRTTDALGVATDFVYDAAGRKIFEVDGAGQLTQYVYDQSSNLVETIQYAGLANKALLSDSNGNPLAVVNAASLIASAESNTSNDIVTRNVYDGANRLGYSIDGAGDVTGYSYDGASQLIGTIQYATPISIARTVGVLAYTPGSINGSALTASVNDRTTRRFYDTDGKLAGTLDAAGYLTQNLYDGAGNLSETIKYATASASANRATGTLAQLVPAADLAHDQYTYYFYDGEGRQVGVLDPQNYLTQTVYDLAGNPIQIIRFPNPVSFTGTPNFASILPASTAGAHITAYQYNELNQVIQETNYEGTVTTYQYDAVGNLLTKTLAASTTDSQIYQSQYDALGRITATLSPVGAALITTGMTAAQINAIWTQYGTTYAYDADGHLVATTDPAGDTTHDYYDADGRLRLSINALGEVVETRYNALGEVSDRIDYVGRVAVTGLTGGLLTPAVTAIVNGIANATVDSHTTYTYALSGELATQTSAEGASTNYTYDAFGDVVSTVQAITTSAAQTTQFTYDARGQLTQTAVDPAGIDAILKKQYDAFGRVISSTDADNNTTTFVYDRLGRTVLVTNPLAGADTTSYDAFSRILTTVDARNQTTSYQYNDATRSVTVTTPQGVAVTTTHTRNGQTASVTNALGTTYYLYDASGHLTRKYDSLGTLEQDTYDADGRVTITTDANGIVTQILYDAANRVFTRTVDPTGLKLVTTYQYDGEGRSVQTTDSKGVVTTTAYDRDGRVLTTKLDPTGLNIQTTYSYDLRGDLLVTTLGAGSANPQVTSYTYDALGRRTTDSVALGLGQGNALTQYFYDGAGNMTRKIDANGYSTWYVYDADNRVAFVVDALGGVTQNSYDAAGNVISTRRYATTIATSGFGNVVTLAQVGTPTTSAADRIDQTVFDNDGRIVYSIDPAMGVTQTIYDAAGNAVESIAYATPLAAGTYTTVASVTAALTANAAADHTLRKIYDSRDELRFAIDALGDVKQTVYDGVGNITQTTAYATPASISGQPTLATLTTWVASNASAADRTTRYWYDSIGREVLSQDAVGYLTRTIYNDAAHTKQTIRYATAATIAAGATTAQAIAAVVTSAFDQSTTDAFDTAGRLATETDGLGHTQRFQYDAVGNKTQYTDQNGAVWTYVYDANRRMIEEHDPQVNVTTVTAGANSLTPAAPVLVSLVTQVTYDALGNVLSRTEAYGRPEARTTSYQYDALGRQVLTTYPTTYVYNAAGDTTPFAATVARTETKVTPQSSVTYNALGDAVLSVDVNGDVTRKAYDQLGRVVYEVDALNYVTAHTYDAFGNETSLTRYASALNTSGLSASLPWTRNQIAAGLVTSAGTDRTTTKSYDLLNRAVQIVQPSVFNYLPTTGSTAGGTSVIAAATTLYDYDAFGDVTRTRALADPTSSTYATTYYYYDQRGLQIASVDPGNYLTMQSYDSRGNLTAKYEYFNPLTAPLTSPSVTPPGAPATNAGDRQYAYGYDALNRMTSQTLLNLATTTISGTTTTAASVNQNTYYQYDGVGNEIAQTDTQGNTTYTYYDALGRVTAVAQPAESTGSGSVTPLVSMGRDAFGDLTSQTQYAAGAATATSASYTAAAAPTPTSAFTFAWTVPGTTAASNSSFAYRLTGTSTYLYVTPVLSGSTFTVSVGSLPPGTYDFTYTTTQRVGKGSVATTAAATGQFTVSGSTASFTQTVTAGSPTVSVSAIANPTQNRVTVIEYDAYANAIATQDPNGNLRQASYDIRGNVAKQWQNVTNPNDGSTESIVTVNTYDALNRLTVVTTPQTATASQVAVTQSVYDSFGDIIHKGTYAAGTSNPTLQENYSYDQAGRLWRTNSGDGVYKVYQYDLLGNQTAVITSQNYDLSTLASAQAALALPAANQMRQETRYDLLGHAIQQRSATFQAAPSLEPISAGFQFGTLSIPVPPNAIYQAVTVNRAKGGSYTYYVINPTTWANGGGYYQVSAPSASNPLGTYARVAQTSYQLVQHGTINWTLPTALGVTATFTYSGTSSGTLAVNQLNSTQEGVDISGLPSGNYSYTVTYTRATDTTPYAEATGTFSVSNSVVTTLVSGAATAPNASVTFSWSDAANAGSPDFTYYASGTTNYVYVPPTQNGTSFSAALGVLAPGTYNYVFDTYRPGGKAGLQTVSSVTGTFTVANGAVTLWTPTIVAGTPTNIAVSSNIPAVATPTVAAVASGAGAVISWSATNLSATATVEIQQGSGAWTSYAATLSGSVFSATVPTLSAGTYNYRVTEHANGEIVALGTGTLSDSPSTTTVSGVTPSAPNTTLAPISGSESTQPGNPSVAVNWSSDASGTSADLYYGPAGTTPTTYVSPTLTGTTTIPGVTTITGLTQNAAVNPLYVGALLGTTSTNYGNPTVGFTWTSTGSFGDFSYKLSSASTATAVTPTVSGSVFSVAMGALAAGTYTFSWDAFRTAPKGGDVETAAGTGTFTVANGVATLTSSTITLGSPTNVALTGTPGGGNSTTTVQWNRPADAAVTASFGYRVSGSGSAFTIVTPTVGATAFTAQIFNLAPGTYDFEAINSKSGTTIDLSTGTFVVTATSATFSAQTHTAPASFATVGYSGGSLTWTAAASAGDSISVTVVNSSGVATTLAATGGGSSWSASLQPLDLTDTFTYTINYTHSGSSSPYLQATGSLTTSATLPTVLNNWTANIGLLPAGSYAFNFDTTRTARKGGDITVLQGSGTFNVGSGTAGLTSETVTVGALQSMNVTGTPTSNTYSTTIQWARPADTTIYASFGYRVSGSGAAYTTVAPTLGTSNFITTLPNLPFGTYDYQASILQDYNTRKGGTNTVTLDTSAGQFVVSASGVSFLSQSHTTPTSISAVSSSGSALTWTQAPAAGDTITVTVMNSTGVVTTLTPSGSGGNYSASLAGLLSGNYSYTINYTAAGQTTPYRQGTGYLTVTTSPVTVTASATTGVGGIASFLDGGNNVLYWTNSASSGSTVTFSYRALGATTWAGTLPVSAYGTGFSVNLAALSGTIEYEVVYTAAGQTTPYIVANGRTTINRAGATTGSVVDTTGTTLTGITATPTVEQTYDRWGDVTSVTDASSNTTSYTYNQLGELTQVTLPQTSALSTAGGTITSLGLVAASEINYYDSLGRLIGKRDGNGNLDTETYNADGLELSETHADGGSKQFVYDGFGEQIQITEAATSSINYRTRNAYDNDGQLLETAREITVNGFASATASDLTAANSSGIVEFKYTYDAAGRRVSSTNGQLGSSGTLGTLRYWYNQQGQIVKTQTPLGFVESYQYDLQGNKTQDLNALGNAQSWTYNYFGKVLTSTDLGGTVTTSTYNPYDDGLLTSQTSTIGGVAAANITYSYDAAGHLLTIHDRGAAAGGLLAVNRDTTYAYDTAGRQSRDTVVIDGLTHQDTQISYDQQDRVSQLSDIGYRDNYSYDKAGNRTLVQAKYFDYTGALQRQSLYYTYDAMNRVTTSQGANIGGVVGVNMMQGIQLTYDYKGDRLSAYQYGQIIDYSTASNTYSYTGGYNLQSYTYDGLGDLLTTNSTELTNTTTSQVQTDSRTYDKAQRVTSETTYTLDTTSTPTAAVTRYSFTTYDGDGRIATQMTYNGNNAESFISYGESTNTTTSSQTVTNPFTGAQVSVAWSGAWTPGYDAAGNLRGYIEEVFTPSSGALAYTSTDTISYRNGSTYQETGESITSTSNGPESGSTQYTYNVDNQLASFVDLRDQSKDRYFADDANGNMLTVVQGEYDGASGRLTSTQAFAQALNDTGGYNTTLSQHFFFALGQQIGSFGQLTDNGTFAANFDVNYTPISQSYPAAVPNQVVAEQGDTLRTIAARIYGDANLWYVIAQENGLTDANASLTAGTVLRIPNSVVSLSNTSSAYKPYSAADAIGNTTPTQPTPPPQSSSSGGGCGVLGEILIVVVAIIVTIYSAGLASEALAAAGAPAGGAAAGASAGSLAETFTAGLAVTSGEAGLSTATIASAAIGGAVGSAVSQGVAIAAGLQSGFNWNDVAGGAIGAGVASGVGAAAKAGTIFAGLDKYSTAAAIATTDSVVTQGISVAVGLQTSFNWTAVAQAAISAPLAVAANDAIAKLAPSVIASNDFTQKLAGGVASAAVRTALGGKFDTVSVVTDAFGTYLGDSITGQTNTAQNALDQSAGLASDNAQRTPSADSAPLNINPIPPEDLILNYPAPDLSDITLPAGRLSIQVQSGDTISSIVGSSNPVDIEAFMRANQITTSTLIAGQPYFLPNSDDYAASTGALGQATLNADNARLAALNAAAAGATAPTVDFMTAQSSTLDAFLANVAALPLASVPTSTAGGGGALQTSQSSADSYWAGVQDDAVADGSPVKYMAATGMRALANFGYSAAGVASAVADDPVSALNGAGKGLVNFGPDAFNGATNLTKLSLDGLTLLAEGSGLLNSGTFASFRDSQPYNIQPLATYDDQAEQGGAILGGLVVGAALAKYGAVQLQSPITVGDSVPYAFGQSGASSFILQNPIVADANAAESVANVATEAGGKVPVQLYDVMTYGESKAGAVVGDELTGDHIPSFAAVRDNVEATLDRPLTRAEESALRDNTNTVVIGEDLHEAGRTYFGANTPTQIAEDATDLGAAALRDQAVHLQNATSLGYDPVMLQASFDKINQMNTELFSHFSTRQSTLDWFKSLGL
jgi:YD repeat-containing protein